MKYYYQRNATTGGDRTIEKNRIIVMYTRLYDIRTKKPELAWSAYSNSKNAINKKDLGQSYINALAKELKKAKLFKP